MIITCTSTGIPLYAQYPTTHSHLFFPAISSNSPSLSICVCDCIMKLAKKNAIIGYNGEAGSISRYIALFPGVVGLNR